MSVTSDQQQSRTTRRSQECVICHSKAIGVNFGVSTCAPCKAFFRRNARRKEILQSSCCHYNINLSLVTENRIIRRCSSCRLRRCFDMGMKEELIRTAEENIQHKQLIDTNRQRRELFKQRQREKSLTIPQFVTSTKEYLSESDWRHLSNIVSAYETYCLKTYVQQRSAMLSNPLYEHYTALPISLTASLFSFLRSLPAFNSLSQNNRTYLSNNNLRSLLFPNLFELNQTCYSEPWQISLDKLTWKLICGQDLYEQFVQTENLAERLLITDPTVTRLWLVVLFFSSSLFCFYDKNSTFKIPKKKTTLSNIQNTYVTLLWNYLLHRYGDRCATQIYSNLIHVYIRMQGVGFNIGVQVRTRNELLITHQTLNQLLTLNIRDG